MVPFVAIDVEHSTLRKSIIPSVNEIVAIAALDHHESKAITVGSEHVWL